MAYFWKNREEETIWDVDEIFEKLLDSNEFLILFFYGNGAESLTTEISG